MDQHSWLWRRKSWEKRQVKLKAPDTCLLILKGSQMQQVRLHAAKARLVEASYVDEEPIDEESINEEAWKEVMPPDRPGRVLGMGAGVTPTQFRGGRKVMEDALLDQEIKVLRDQLSAANMKIEKMEVVVRDVGKIKKMKATIAK